MWLLAKKSHGGNPMKRIALFLILAAIVPLKVNAFNTYDHSDVLSYVAMPLAVSAVCDVRGVQTDRVGQLVAYMDQANVAPADFIDVFRYVPVALVLRTDNRPDFVEWVHGQVDRGLVGGGLVTAMETQLRTYDTEVPQAGYRSHRRYARNDDEYAYAYEPDYVPVVIRRHCDRFFEDSLSLVVMPLAIDDVCDLGVPYDRVSSLAVELNLGDVGPVQFVELMRYAPAALVVNGGGYYGQPDFIQFVRTSRIQGFTGYQLVQAAGQQLQAYNIAPQIDLAPPAYVGQTYYVPQVAQNWVDPANQAFIPQAVSTRVAASVTAGRTAFNQQAPGFNQNAPAIAATPQVQRLLSSPSGAAVVANPGQARRELARENRLQRETPLTATPPSFAGSVAAGPRRIGNQGRHEAIAQQPVFSNPAIAGAPRGNGRGEHGRALTPMISSTPEPSVAHEHGRGHAAASGPATFAAPAPVVAQPPREHGRGHAATNFVQAPVAAPPPAQAQAPHEHGRGHAAAPAFVPAPAAAPAPAPAPAPQPRQEHGHGGGQPAVAAAPAPAASAPPAAPPGQEKKKDKGKGNDQ
jgi:hypothetical protein